MLWLDAWPTCTHCSRAMKEDGASSLGVGWGDLYLYTDAKPQANEWEIKKTL